MNQNLFFFRARKQQNGDFIGVLLSLQPQHPALLYRLLRVSVSKTEQLSWVSMKWQSEVFIYIESQNLSGILRFLNHALALGHQLFQCCQYFQCCSVYHYLLFFFPSDFVGCCDHSIQFSSYTPRRTLLPYFEPDKQVMHDLPICRIPSPFILNAVALHLCIFISRLLFTGREGWVELVRE